MLWEPAIARLAIRMCRLRFLDQAYSGHAPGIARIASANVVEETSVDLEDEFKLTRDEKLHPFHRPALERLGKKGVVGVGEFAA